MEKVEVPVKDCIQSYIHDFVTVSWGQESQNVGPSAIDFESKKNDFNFVQFLKTFFYIWVVA